MSDPGKTRQQLEAEIVQLRRRVAEIELAEAERKRAESQRETALEALRKSKESYYSFISQSHEAIYCTEFDQPIDTSLPVEQQIDAIYENAYLGECNQAMAAMYGLPSIDSFIGQRLVDFHGGNSNPVNRATFRRFIESNYRSVDCETEEVTPTGEKRFFLTSDIGIVQNGKLLRIWGSATDVTARKQAEAQREAALEALRQSEKRFRLLVESSPDAIFVQTEGRLVYVNDAAIHLFGASAAEDLLGTPMLDRLHPAFSEMVRERIRILNEKRASVPRIEVRYRRLDGTPVPSEVSAVPIRYEGQDGALVFVRDITERKRAQEEREKLQAQLSQAQRMESVGRLAGGIAHDFNNMLSVILGHTELAMRQIDPASPLYLDVEEIYRASQRSADLTRQLLAFARRQIVTVEVLDLNDTIAGMLKMLRRLIGEDIDLAWLPGAGLWPVKIDPSQIDQILANLCLNARDAIRDMGKITIETTNVFCDETYCAGQAGVVPGPYVLLAVSDDGQGMDREVLAHLFEPFFTTKETGQGSGLGLSIVYGIVKQNQGFINVYSEPGLGTTFKIYLPRSMEKLVPTVEAPRPTLPGGRETVLLVEDEAAILHLVKAVLRQAGYEVLTASTPGEALRRVQAHTGKIDLLISDVVMPEMNGRDLAVRIEVIHPEVKCLYMSGYTENVIAHRGVLDEGVWFLQKPFSIDELAAKVREVLEQNKEKQRN
jgi:two-component system cell cycle sensor histidine kinase/response regulator CckA